MVTTEGLYSLGKAYPIISIAIAVVLLLIGLKMAKLAKAIIITLAILLLIAAIVMFFFIKK